MAPMRTMPIVTYVVAHRVSHGIWVRGNDNASEQAGCSISTHSRIEQAPTNPKKHPSIHSQRKPKRQGYIKQLRRVFLLDGRHYHRSCIGIRGNVGDLSSCEREEEEGDGADEFAYYCYGMPASGFGKTAEEGAEAMVGVGWEVFIVTGWA